jgi:F-type H+-transporting ATPase subunit epsilon
MSNVMHLDLVDSESRVFEGEVEYIVATAVDGEIGIYPNHIGIIVILVPGALRIKLPNNDEQLVLALSGGYLEVCNNKIVILADVVTRTDDLDETRLIEQKKDAIDKLSRSDSSSTFDVAKVQASLEITIAQIKASNFLKNRKKLVN